MNYFKEAAIDAAKVAVAAFATVCIDPGLDKLFPALAGVPNFLIGAIIAAAILQVFLTVVIGRRPVTVVWKPVGDPTPTGSVVVKFKGQGAKSEQYTVSVHSPKLGWVAGLLSNALVNRGLRLKMTLVAAPVYTAVQNGTRSQVDERRLVYEERPAAVVFEMTELIGDGLWRSGEITMTSSGTLSAEQYLVDYSWWVNGKKSKWARHVLKIVADVKAIRITGV